MPKATVKTEKSSTASVSSSSLAYGSASWAQASAEAGLGGLTMTEAALAAMFDQLKEVPDPIFAVSMHTLTASWICRESVKNVEKLSKNCWDCQENIAKYNQLPLQCTDPHVHTAWHKVDEEGGFVVLSDDVGSLALGDVLLGLLLYDHT